MVAAAWVVPAIVIAVCLVDLGFAISLATPTAGPTADDLNRRYGELHERLDGVARVAYFADTPVRFVGARYALAPIVLDIRYVDFKIGDRVIRNFDLDALVEDAAEGRPLVVLGEFSEENRMAVFTDDLARAASSRGIEAVETWRSDGLILLKIGG
jgi:hypothetical protein